MFFENHCQLLKMAASAVGRIYDFEQFDELITVNEVKFLSACFLLTLSCVDSFDSLQLSSPLSAVLVRPG